jgi:hypothetical protein
LPPKPRRPSPRRTLARPRRRALSALRRRGALAACAISIAVAPRRSLAEGPADVAVARELFREGSRHAQRGAWEEARERFERSLALRRAALTLYSLGVAQKNLGLLVEATESFYAFLSEPSVPSTKPYEGPARVAIAELEKRLAHVTLRISPPDAGGLRVRIDNDDVPHESLGVPRPINPGDHFLAVSALGHRPASQPFHVGEGEGRELLLSLEPFALSPRGETLAPPAPRPAAPARPPVRPPEPPSQAGPWLLAAAGALATAGGLWVSLDALDAGDGQDTRRRDLFGRTLTTGGLVSLGVGLGLLLVAPPAPTPAPTRPPVARLPAPKPTRPPGRTLPTAPTYRTTKPALASARAAPAPWPNSPPPPPRAASTCRARPIGSSSDSPCRPWRRC